MKNEINERGFSFYRFKDHNNEPCTLQKSSLAFVDCVWLGVDSADPKIMVKDARDLGLATGMYSEGWMPYPIPESVALSTRMHLNREQVKELLPLLQNFVETGEI